MASTNTTGGDGIRGLAGVGGVRLILAFHRFWPSGFRDRPCIPLVLQQDIPAAANHVFYLHIQ